MNIVIADRFIALRKSHHLSQEELAEKLGVSRQAVSKWERAESNPDMDNLISISKLYKISLDALLSEEGYDMEERGNGPEPKLASGYTVLDEKSGAGKGETAEIDSRFLTWMARCYPIIVTLVFLYAGFGLNLWHPGWLLYLTIPIFYTYYHVYVKSGK
jgi:transcriptional regulator with XRE-family HTH domain